MDNNRFKIGYSDVGGIYIGRNIQSKSHKHYAISILISFGPAFKITTAEGKQDSFKVAIIQKNICYNLQTSHKDYVVFIHIDPCSKNGLLLSNKEKSIQKLEISPFTEVLADFKNWFESSENSPDKVELLLNKVASIPKNTNGEKVTTDKRIKKSLDLIKLKIGEENLSLHQIAAAVHLSESHFARLFKKETEMTFRQFVLHRKLIRSIYAMYEQNSLTHASFSGGFSDQPHFTRTFINAFGIKPSSTIK